MNSIQVVGFDLDGTLYKQTPEMQGKIRTRIYEKISESLGIPFEQAQDSFLQVYSQLESGSKTVEQIAKSLGKRIDGSELVQDALQEADTLDMIPSSPELAGMLKRLSTRFGLDLLTRSEYDFAIKKLSRLGVQNSFQNILSHCDGSKLDGVMYKNWIAGRHTEPASMLYVGDNKRQDIEVPKSMGIQTCFLGENSQADYHIKDILELEKILYS